MLPNLFRKSIICALTCLTASAGPALAADLRVATEGYYAPFNYFNDQGELAGFDVDIAQALCAKMEITCEIVSNEWDDLIPGLNADQYDVIVASMSITEERLDKVAFTLPYYSNMLTFIGKSDENVDVTTDGLQGKSVGVLRSTVSSIYLAESYGEVVESIEFDTQDDALNALVEGKVDLVLGDNLPLYDWLQSDVGQGHAFIGEFIDIDDRIGIAVRHEEDELLNSLNDALIEILENGTYQEINADYFPFSIYF